VRSYDTIVRNAMFIKRALALCLQRSFNTLLDRLNASHMGVDKTEC